MRRDDGFKPSVIFALALALATAIVACLLLVTLTLPLLVLVSCATTEGKAVQSASVEQTEPIPVTVLEKPAVEEPALEPELVSLGEFTMTAYCSCRTCCGRWAEGRPLDKDGREIVYTASGAVAEAGVTIAVDTQIIPHGTVVVIDGHEYIAQDTGYGIDGNRIDIYHSDHQAAREYGVQKHEVFVKEGL